MITSNLGEDLKYLTFLYDQKGQVVSKQSVLLTKFGEDDYFKDRGLGDFISKLRKYLNHYDSVDIENIQGVRFRLKGQILLMKVGDKMYLI